MQASDGYVFIFVCLSEKSYKDHKKLGKPESKVGWL